MKEEELKASQEIVVLINIWLVHSYLSMQEFIFSCFFKRSFSRKIM